MSEVILIKHHLMRELRKVVKQKVNRFSKGDKIAIKLHMGEYGNLSYIRPPLVELIVDELKKIGVEPFLFDTPTLYSGERDTTEKYSLTARKNGFSKDTMGCPVVTSDVPIEMKSKFFKTIELAKEMYEADGVIVLSHFKGHELVNFGGAIKNIGMGGVTKKGKKNLHIDTRPVIGDKCTGCGRCVEVCPENAVSLKNGKVHIDFDSCFGCGTCVDFCPVNNLTNKTTDLSSGLAEVCSLYLKKYGKKTLFINVLTDITSRCDCYPIGNADVSHIVPPDLGITVSDDLVAIDKCSLDLVEKATKNKFGKIFKSDPLKQIKDAKKFNLGSEDYEIREV